MNRTAISVLLALCIAGIKASDDDMTAAEIERTNTRHRKCLEKEKLTQQEVDMFAMTDRNPKLKCLAACILEQAGVLKNCEINDKRFIVDEKLRELYPIFEACKPAVVAKERCECGYQFTKCLDDLKEYAKHES